MGALLARLARSNQARIFVMNKIMLIMLIL